MLKVKDNVDLKELEKYGFNYNKEVNEYVNDINDTEALIIDKSTKQVQLYIFDEYWMCVTQNNSFDLLFDLIQANLIEKVGD